MMKFDSTSIYNRAIDKLQQDPNWRPITNNSVISSLVKSNSEINSEIARYAEYLFKESKWNTAQNTSSILAMANMLGYQPKRSVSASGTLYVSADPKTHLLGKTKSFEDFEELGSDSSKNTIGWIANPYGDIIITPSSVIKDSSGKSYIADGYYTLFGEGGSSGNRYYTTIGILEGTRKSQFIDIETIRSTYTTSKMYPYLYIPFRISNCENASNLNSKRFFKVYVVTDVSDSSEVSLNYKEYRIVDNLLLSNSDDFDVEVYNDLYNRELFYAKFNNDPARGSSLDLSTNSSLAGLRIDYLESSGYSGNLNTTFENFTILNTISSKTQEDSGIKLYGVNKYPISGGKDPETSSEIKTNATKFYISNYSVGTKESYEKTILNTEFLVKNTAIKPKKVRVYSGMTKSSSSKELNQPATYVSFISNNLEDISTSDDSQETYTAIEDSLNYYLGRLKSPQDILKFEPPRYVPLAVGIKCAISNQSSSTNETSVIETSVRSLIDSNWGPNSDTLDFGNSFTPSGLSKYLMNQISDLTSLDIEVEAVKKLLWSTAERISIDTSTIIHTCRIPFSFSPVFLGNSTYSGFKDFKSGAKYVIRFDFMYKKPTTLTGNSLNKSIFVAEPSNGERSTDSFYTYHDQDNYWTNILSQETRPINYQEIGSADFIGTNNCHQVNLISSVYNDNDFSKFLERLSSGEEVSRNSATDAGAIDNYLIYFSGNYDSESTSIGEGWIEIGFDALYNILEAFAIYDDELSEKLVELPLSMLKCDTSSVTDESLFEEFKSLVSKYLDIYVSMRPIDNNLKLITSSLSKNVLSQNNKSVLYIDSYDSSLTSTNQVENLTEVKRNRMISVSCDYEEN